MISPPIDWVAVPYRVESPADHFLISKFPVTVAQFEAFLEAKGYERQELWSARGWAWRTKNGFREPAYWNQADYANPQFPVTGVSFWEAEAFARFAEASLPTEQEWLSASSNHGATRYPWGDEYDDKGPRRANLNFFGAMGDRGLRTVDGFPDGQSKLGVWDLLGNVSEWSAPKSTDPADAVTGVLRGGCFWHTPVAVDAQFWDTVNLNTRDNQTGIRLVRRTASAHAAPVVQAPSASVVLKKLNRHIHRPSTPFRQEGVPAELTKEAWRLRVTGDVATPLELSFDTLVRDFPRSELAGMFVCVCRWGELNRFAGISVKDFVERVKPTAPLGEIYVHQQSVVGPTGKSYESWISVAELIAHDALLAYEMDGKPLSMDLGWPLRLVDLHLFAYKAVKCLGELRFTTTFAQGWWETECQYDPHGVVQPGVITVVGAQPYRRILEAPGRVRLTAEEEAILLANAQPSK